MNKEEWKDIAGYEGIYKVSSFGRVIAYAKTWFSGRWVTRRHPEKEMKFSVDRKGYYIVGLRKGGIQKMHKVHRLVATAFVPNPQNKPQVNHKDTDKKNNHADNLEWATSGENMQHAHDNGLMNLKVREKHPRAKLKAKDIPIIRNSHLSDCQLSKQFGVSRSAIESVRNGRTWKPIEHQKQNNQ